MDKCHYTELNIRNLKKNKEKSIIYLWRQVLVSSGVWLSYFGFGLATGSCTVVIAQLRKEANSTHNIIVSDSMASWITAGNNYGAFTAVIFTSIVSSFVGRKPIYMFAAIATIISNLLFYFSVDSTQILISEIVQGINGACVLTIDLMILSEYTSSNYRGVFLTIKTAMMFWGIWVANAIGTFFYWRNIGIVGIICSTYTLVVSFFWPESPYWLAEKGHLEECMKSHRWLKGQSVNAEKELDLLLQISKNIQTEDFSISKKCKLYLRQIVKKEFYKPTLISMLIICMYHSTGKYVFSVYAIDIIKKITKDERTAYIAMLFLDGITVLGMYIGCILSKFMKRRTLFFSCSAVGVLSLFFISGYLYSVHLAILIENKYLSVILLTIFSLSVSMGPIVLSSSLIGELAPLKLRNLSFCVTIFFNFAVIGNTVLIAPAMFVAFKTYGAFLMYGVLSLIFLFILYRYLPETKDKTLHEIRDLILGKKTEILLNNL